MPVLLVLLVLVSLEAVLQAASLLVRSRTSAVVPAADVVILCIGDSHTYGADPEESYPALLQRHLDEAAPGRFAVVNLGVPGMNTSQMLARLPLQVARYAPDLVIAWAGANNAWNATGRDGEGASWLETAESAAMHSRLYRLVRVLLHDGAIHRAARSDGVGQTAARSDCAEGECDEPRTVWSLGEAGELDVVEHRPREEGRDDARQEASVHRDYTAVADWLAGAGIPFIVIRYPLELHPTASANRAIDRVARERSVPVLRADEPIARLTGRDRFYAWGNHPNPAMYREVARDLLPLVDAAVGLRGDAVRAAGR